MQECRELRESVAESGRRRHRWAPACREEHSGVRGVMRDKVLSRQRDSLGRLESTQVVKTNCSSKDGGGGGVDDSRLGAVKIVNLDDIMCRDSTLDNRDKLRFQSSSLRRAMCAQ